MLDESQIGLVNYAVVLILQKSQLKENRTFVRYWIIRTKYGILSPTDEIVVSHVIWRDQPTGDLFIYYLFICSI